MWKYLKFVFTRWYFWLVYLFLFYHAINNGDLSLADRGFSVGVLLAIIFWAGILPSISYYEKKKKLKNK